MVSVKKKIVGKQEYYYLEHSIREGNRVIKKEKYLGKIIPKNIDELKKEFIYASLREKWFSLFNKIKDNYIIENKKMPLIAKEKFIQDFSVKFTYNSQKIEGSTLTLKETANLLLRGIAPNKPINDIKEAESHKKIFLDMLDYKKELTLAKILEWHKELMINTKPEIAGKIRNYQVVIGGSKFIPPSATIVKTLLTNFIVWFNNNKIKIHPVELAGLVHLKFVTIHPFADGNGRISRILMNFVLSENNYPLLNIKYDNRNSYYSSLEKAQVKDEELTFIKWFFKEYFNQNKKDLKL